MSGQAIVPDAGTEPVPAKWRAVHAAAPGLAATMLDYVAQIAVSLRPATARAVETDLRLFAGFLVDHDP